MSPLARFFDHSCNVHRLTETPNALHEHVDTWTLQPSAEPLLIEAVPGERRTDEGAGETRRGIVNAYARRDANIEETDVLEIVSGPLAPVNLRVLTVYHPTGHRHIPHHTEITVERFVGVLP